MEKQLSRFAAPKGAPEPGAGGDEVGAGDSPDFEDPKVMRAMAEIERDMDHLDENNPRHMARVMKKMKDALPPGTMPRELDDAIKRLEKGEDPEKVEADMEDVLGSGLGLDEDEQEEHGGGSLGGPSSYSRDTQLYDY